MRHKKKFVFIILAPLLLLLASAVVMLLWNYSLVEATGVNPLTFWQATALLVLSRILFGGFRFGPKGGGGPSKWRSKWKGMSEEERKQFRENWKQRCGDHKREG